MIDTRQLLLLQGFSAADVAGGTDFAGLARWTPLCCAAFGLVGVWLGNGWYLLGLGALTMTGGFTASSIYDRLFNHLVRFPLHARRIPDHGNPRRFGCAIGGMMYLLGGSGWLLHNAYLAYLPTLFIITFAAIAGLTHWCFASTLYQLIFGASKEAACCCTTEGADE